MMIKKINDYVRSVHFYVGIVGVEESEQEKQQDYISRLKKMRNHLLAFKDELNLILSSKQKSQRLDKIEKKTKSIEFEADRRAAVADEKRWGAVIELIDIQRDELKKKGLLNQEIVEIKKDISDIKSFIYEFKENIRKIK